MDEVTYRSELMSTFDDTLHRPSQRYASLKRCCPAGTRAVQIMVHPSQDPDGMFSVLIHLDGPERHILNKAINGCRTLFEVRYIEGKLQPEVPFFDPFSLPLELNDMIVDTATIWVQELWLAVGALGGRLPAYVSGEEGIGTAGTVQLTA